MRKSGLLVRIAILGPWLVSAALGGSDGAVLRFTIGMHIEPPGTTAEGYSRPTGGDDRNPAFFARHVEDIRSVARIVEQHGGRMTIQAQSPFTSAVIQQ